jgi:hypothetical protein
MLKLKRDEHATAAGDAGARRVGVQPARAALVIRFDEE